MATKADFNAEEWDRLREGPAAAAVLVIAADKGGSLRESVALDQVASTLGIERSAGGPAPADDEG